MANGLRQTGRALQAFGAGLNPQLAPTFQRQQEFDALQSRQQDDDQRSRKLASLKLLIDNSGNIQDPAQRAELGTAIERLASESGLDLQGFGGSLVQPNPVDDVQQKRNMVAAENFFKMASSGKFSERASQDLLQKGNDLLFGRSVSQSVPDLSFRDDPSKPINVAAGGAVVDPESGEVIFQNPARSQSLRRRSLTGSQVDKLNVRKTKMLQGLSDLQEASKLVTPQNVGLVGAVRRGADLLQGTAQGVAGFLGRPGAVSPDEDREASKLKNILQGFKGENWKEIVGPGGLTAQDQKFLDEMTAQGLRITAEDAQEKIDRLMQIFGSRVGQIDQTLEPFGGQPGTIVEGAGVSASDVLNMSDSELDAAIEQERRKRGAR